jgi:hypothetical protein
VTSSLLLAKTRARLKTISGLIKQALINIFGDFIVKFNQSNPLVPPENLYYIAGSFGNPEIYNTGNTSIVNHTILETLVFFIQQYW